MEGTMNEKKYVACMENIAKSMQDIEANLLQIHSYVELLRGGGEIKVCVPYETKNEEPR